MDDNRKLALYVAYYLSKFHSHGRDKLGYKTWTKAFDDIGKKLSCPPRTVSNWRDEFNVLFGFRAPRNYRGLSQSRAVVARALEGLEERQVFWIVNGILSKTITADSAQGRLLLANIPKKPSKQFIDRGTTGTRAEDIFLDHHKNGKIPMTGELEDCREKGTGYDFKIVTPNSTVFVEVKGLAGASGGVLFTDKEWSVALNEGNSYYLCLVSNVANESEIRLIQNPAQKLNPKQHLNISFQVSWGITENQLSAIDD